jgi:hypothetical protein
MGRTNLSGPLYVGGIPVGGIGIPATWGNYFYVNADTNKGSDSNDGLTMETALATVAAAYAKVTSNNHDVIVLSGNSAHVLASQLAITKNRMHIVGLGLGHRYMGQRTRITMGDTAGTGIAAINNTGVGNTFTNLKITSSDTLSTSVYCMADGGEFSQWNHCWFEKTTDLDQAGAAEVLCNADTGFYNHCTFGNMIYQPSVARQNILFTRETITGKVARDVIFEDCLFQSFATATTFVNLRATANDIERLAYFKRCLFASKAGSSTQALVCGIASALTDAHITLHDCAVQNITDVAAGSKGVYTTSPTPSATGTETVQVTTT